MNCHDAQPYLDRYDWDRRDCPSIDRQHPDPVALREHIEHCPSCQNSVRSIAQWDSQISRAITDVAIPVGLSKRLIIKLQEDCPTETGAVTSKPQRVRRIIKRLTTAVLAMTLVIATGFMLNQFVFKHFPLTSAHVASLLSQPTADLPRWNASTKHFPRQWSSLTREISSGEWRRAELTDIGATIGVSEFEVRSKPGPVIEGTLFAIPKSRWKPLPPTNVLQTTIQYSPRHVWFAWTEGEFVYLVSLNGPATSLEKIQRKLAGNDAVL